MELAKILGILIACTFYSLNIVHAQKLKKLPSKYKKIKKYMDKAASEGLVGMAFYIDHPKHGEWIGTSGLAGLENKLPVKENSVFYLGSISKTYTATVVMYLVEQEKLTLDDKISKYLPNEIIENFENAERATVKHLLNMTSGFPNFEYDSTLLEDYFDERINIDTIPPADLLKKYMYGQPANFEQGQKYQYSSTNYILLTMIIDKVYGQPHQNLYTELFKKIDLDNTYYKNEIPPVNKLVQGYADMDNDGLVENVTKRQAQYANWSVGEDGVKATVKDVGIFMKKLAENKILSKQSLLQMQEWMMPENPRYGLGLMYSKGFPYKYYIGHSGWGFGTQAQVFYFPKQQITVAILCDTGYRFGGEAIEKAYDKFIKRASIKLFLF